MSDLAQALVRELADDPVALSQLRRMLDMRQEQPAPEPAYTVRSLAESMGRTERSIRGAIDRGELEAVKRGRGYVISSQAVQSWATPSIETTSSTRSPHRGGTRRSGPGAMRRGLAGR